MLASSNYNFQVTGTTLRISVETTIPAEGVGSNDGPEDMSNENLQKMKDIVGNNLCDKIILSASLSRLSMSGKNFTQQTSFPLSENFVNVLREMPSITSCTLEKPWTIHCASRYAQQQAMEKAIQEHLQ